MPSLGARDPAMTLVPRGTKSFNIPNPMPIIKDKADYVPEINRILQDDEHCTNHIPLNPDDNSLFSAFEDGIVMAKLLLAVDENALNLKDMWLKQPVSLTYKN